MPGVADDVVSRMRAAGVRMIFGLPGGGGNLDIVEAAAQRGAAVCPDRHRDGIGDRRAGAGRSHARARRLHHDTRARRGVRRQRRGVRVPRSRAARGGHRQSSVRRRRLRTSATRSPRAARACHQVVRLPGRRTALQKHSTRASRACRSCRPAPCTSTGRGQTELTTGARTGVGPGSDRGRRSTGSDPGRDSRHRAQAAPDCRPCAARRAEDAAAIRAFCESRGVPALVTYKAKGVVPDTHPWFGGVFTHGALERALVTQADLLIGVGFDPVEILPRAWDYPQPIVSIAPWRMADDHVPFQSQIVGDIVSALGDLSVQLPSVRVGHHRRRAHPSKPRKPRSISPRAA